MHSPCTLVVCLYYLPTCFACEIGRCYLEYFWSKYAHPDATVKITKWLWFERYKSKLPRYFEHKKSQLSNCLQIGILNERKKYLSNVFSFNLLLFFLILNLLNFFVLIWKCRSNKNLPIFSLRLNIYKFWIWLYCLEFHDSLLYDCIHTLHTRTYVICITS